MVGRLLAKEQVGVRFSLTAPKNNEQGDYIFGVYWEPCSQGETVHCKDKEVVLRDILWIRLGTCALKDVLKSVSYETFSHETCLF